MTAHQIQDEQVRDIVLSSLRLPDDYEDRLMFNVYCPSREETELKEMLLARYEYLHPTEARSNDPLNTLTQDTPETHLPHTGKYETPKIPTKAVPTTLTTNIRDQFAAPTDTKEKSLEQ
jgi:hypothetical protein